MNRGLRTPAPSRGYSPRIPQGVGSIARRTTASGLGTRDCGFPPASLSGPARPDHASGGSGPPGSLAPARGFLTRDGPDRGLGPQSLGPQSFYRGGRKGAQRTAKRGSPLSAMLASPPRFAVRRAGSAGQGGSRESFTRRSIIPAKPEHLAAERLMQTPSAGRSGILERSMARHVAA